MSDQATFELRCGVTLTLKPVNKAVISAIQAKMIQILAENTEVLAILLEVEDDKAALADVVTALGHREAEAVVLGERMFTYCVGWGVEEGPPETDTELMEILDLPANKPHIRRAGWVRTLLSDDDEGIALVDAIREL